MKGGSSSEKRKSERTRDKERDRHRGKEIKWTGTKKWRMIITETERVGATSEGTDQKR